MEKQYLACYSYSKSYDFHSELDGKCFSLGCHVQTNTDCGYFFL